MDSHEVIKYPVSTEKSLRLMEAENKLIFVVDTRSNRTQVKKAIEEVFSAKVEKVNVLRDRDGKKRAYVKFKPEVNAIDVATNLGLM